MPTDYVALFTSQPEEAVRALEALKGLNVLGPWTIVKSEFHRIPHGRKGIVFVAQDTHDKWYTMSSVRGIVIHEDISLASFDTPELAKAAADACIRALPNVLLVDELPVVK